MKEEIWRFWHTYKSWFRISNYGRVYNGQSQKEVGFIQAGKRYFYANKKVWAIDKLVYKLFKSDELGGDYVIHQDHNRLNDYEENLDKVETRSDIMRHVWKKRGKMNHGVSPQKKKDGTIRYWRSIIYFNSKHHTKYFHTHEEAQADFILRYEEKYGEKYV